jgi:hypothetical protein
LAALNFSKAIFNGFEWRKPSLSEHQSRLFSRKKTTGVRRTNGVAGFGSWLTFSGVDAQTGEVLENEKEGASSRLMPSDRHAERSIRLPPLKARG